MWFKGFGFEVGFRKNSVAKEDDAAANTEQLEDDIDKVANGLLTPMGDGEDGSMTEPVAAPLPLVEDDEDKDVAEAADALFTPMGGGKTGGAASEGTAEVEDIFKEPTSPENLSPSEEPSGKASEKGDEAVAVEPENEEKDGLFDNLFGQEDEEEESSIQGLIASLPDITVEEVLGAAEEVKVLMREWQPKKLRKVPGGARPKK